MINNFDGKYRFLSNFYSYPIEYEGIVYPSNEHAFQAAKSLDEAVRKEIASLPTPGQAKRMGRHVELRSDWEKVKVDIMYELCKTKFSSIEMKEKLLATGNEPLEEGNTWNDQFWGVCRGKGENHLGKILMKVRDELK